MPAGWFDTVASGSLLLAMLITVLLWRRPWAGCAVATIIVLLGWVLLEFAIEADIQREFQAIEAKQARGEELTYDDGMYDGVGERVAVLFAGWIPGTIGVGIGNAISFLIRLGCKNKRDATCLPEANRSS